MSKITKLSLVSIVICLGITMGLTALAQEDTSRPVDENTPNNEDLIISPKEDEVIEEVTIDEEVSAEDLGVKEPRLLPDSRFYFLKEWARKIRTVITFNTVKKVELENKFANEKLIELKKLAEKEKDPEILKEAAEKYKSAVEKIKSQAEKIKEKTQENSRIEKFMEKYTSQQILHQKLLEKLEEQVPSEAFEKIKEVRETHLEKFKDVMLKLEEKDMVAQRLKEAVEAQTGSKFKEFKDLEILKRVRDKMPEDIKEKLIEKEGEVLETFKEKLEKFSEEEQEGFKKYVEQIAGEKEKQLEILENIRTELKEEGKLKEKLIEVREKIMEKIRVKIETGKLDCPEIEKPNPGFCEEGRIVVKKNEKGCVVDFKCVIPGEVELPSRPEPTEPHYCITLWDPVCGKDGKTYSNNCFARLAGVEIAYKGKCQEKECETDADCDQPKCGPAGTISAKCIGVKARCVEGKCVIVYLKPEPKPEPQTCPILWDPVCGVNGKTYSNSCYAKIAGVRVAYKGKCKQENTREGVQELKGVIE